MDLFFVILVLTVWKNGGNYANACSVLPGGSPRCFEHQEDAKREIDFRLHGDNMMYGLEANRDKLEDVRLGEKYQEVIGHGRDTVRCKRDAYKPEYKTKLYDYSRAITVPFDVIGSAPVTSLFVITNQEAWHCSSEDNNHGFNIEFTRVVTELLSKSALGTLYFFDGTEVTLVPIPSTNTEKLNTAVVKEIKYLHKESNIVLKYEGKLEFIEPEHEYHGDYGVFETLENVRVPDRDETEDYRRDVHYDSEVPESVGLSSNSFEDGLIFTDDQKPFGEIGRRSDKATCEMLEDDARIYDEKLLPYWSYWQNPDGYYEPTLLQQPQFKEHFIVTKHELWKCTIEEKGTFMRSAIEYIGKTPLNRIESFSDNKVWKYRLNHQSESESESVGIRAVHYFNDNENGQQLTFKYNGLMKLIEPGHQGIVAMIKDKLFLSTKSKKFIVNAGRKK